MKLYMKFVIFGIMVFFSNQRKIKAKGQIDIWAEQKCVPDFSTLDISDYDLSKGQRYFAKSRGGDNCPNKTNCTGTNTAGHNCYPGVFYTFSCLGTGVNCNTYTTGPTCKAIPNCRWTRSSTPSNTCYSRCAGCMYVTPDILSPVGKTFTNRWNIATGVEETNATKLLIASEAYDAASKYLVDRNICTNSSGW